MVVGADRDGDCVGTGADDDGSGIVAAAGCVGAAADDDHDDNSVVVAARCAGIGDGAGSRLFFVFSQTDASLSLSLSFSWERSFKAASFWAMVSLSW